MLLYIYSAYLAIFSHILKIINVAQMNPQVFRKENGTYTWEKQTSREVTSDNVEVWLYFKCVSTVLFELLVQYVSKEEACS